MFSTEQAFLFIVFRSISIEKTKTFCSIKKHDYLPTSIILHKASSKACFV